MPWSKNNLNRIALLVFVLFTLGAYISYQIAYKPHESIEEKSVDYTGTAEDFIAEVIQNESLWSNKVVQITGEITAQNDISFTLNKQIYCQKKDPTIQPKPNSPTKISLKGRFIGYDSLLEEIKLDQCILLN